MTGSNIQQEIIKLANIFLGVSLLVILVMVVYVIWHMRMKKMREYHRDKRHKDGIMSEKLNLTSVLPDLSRAEMKKIALEEKANKKIEESIDLKNYDGLPLKPTVYFDPDKDKAKGDEEQPKPKIMRSILSNEPLPKEGEKEAEVVSSEEKEVEGSLWGSVEVEERPRGDGE